MSHVVKQTCTITNLECLKAAAQAIGMEMVEQKKYKWWGYSVGDYKLPEGYKAEDLGKCDYAIRIPNNKTAYEVGVVKSKTNPNEYELLYDFYAGGNGLMNKIGKDAQDLTQAYKQKVAEAECPLDWELETSKLENGDLLVEYVKYE